MIAKILLAPALSAALVAAPAFAGKALAAADQTLGMALSGAYVSSAGEIGTILSAGGVVSAAKIATGEYNVKFNRSLTGCTATATAVSPAASIVVLTGTINDDTWIVRVRNLAGAAADSNFTILNFCAR